jgi:hypothetical protein
MIRYRFRATAEVDGTRVTVRGTVRVTDDEQRGRVDALAIAQGRATALVEDRLGVKPATVRIVRAHRPRKEAR